MMISLLYLPHSQPTLIMILTKKGMGNPRPASLPNDSPEYTAENNSRAGPSQQSTAQVGRTAECQPAARGHQCRHPTPKSGA